MEVIRNVSNSKTFNTAVDIAIVTRISLERDSDGAWCETHSRLMHKPNGKLYLIEETQEPGGREVVTPISRKHAIAWLIRHPARRPGGAAADRKWAERLLSAA
ncbi:hypothetical protein [Bradyrhizobium sp. CCBAU 11357]|uniref:hypothetical protein n=1 Tax=Bradyrhizobium sp. CCBAU 11357 TaxID=1630808 RepID=UPI002304A599|nr:hypothetical protein [Bradyrhizobium sp. CCBAU 11357]